MWKGSRTWKPWVGCSLNWGVYQMSKYSAREFIYTAFTVIMNSGSPHTVRLNSSCPFNQVICELHGVGRAQGQITWQPDDQNAHQCVLQQRHLWAEAEEETERKKKTKKQLNQVALLETVRGKPFLRRKENSLPVALWRPVVPLVICLRLLGEKHFVKAADMKDNIHIKQLKIDTKR